MVAQCRIRDSHNVEEGGSANDISMGEVGSCWALLAYRVDSPRILEYGSEQLLT